MAGPTSVAPWGSGDPAELGAQLTDDIENTVTGDRPADLPEPQIDQGKPERGPDVNP
ncbi:hypothetical protein [Actinomadura sp. 3N407]|uniref:hypothetical protein n=1 Tax=Actinomadura sp. 3N407 TaxID=3457423 RepID=UPI003FCE0EC4